MLLGFSFEITLKVFRMLKILICLGHDVEMHKASFVFGMWDV